MIKHVLSESGYRNDNGRLLLLVHCRFTVEALRHRRMHHVVELLRGVRLRYVVLFLA